MHFCQRCLHHCGSLDHTRPMGPLPIESLQCLFHTFRPSDVTLAVSLARFLLHAWLHTDSQQSSRCVFDAASSLITVDRGCPTFPTIFLMINVGSSWWSRLKDPMLGGIGLAHLLLTSGAPKLHRRRKRRVLLQKESTNDCVWSGTVFFCGASHAHFFEHSSAPPKTMLLAKRNHQ